MLQAVHMGPGAPHIGFGNQLVELEGEVTLEEYLRTQYTDQLIDEGIVAPIEHRHLRGCGDAKDKGVARRANGNGPLTLRTRPACTL